MSVQLRSVLVQLQLKLVLQGRRLDFTGPKPVSMLIEAGAHSNWQAKWDETWKWIQIGEVDARGTRKGRTTPRLLERDQARGDLFAG